MSDQKEPPKPPGTQVGRYTLQQEVGRGGMGSVYRAIGPDGGVVAVKLLASHLTSNEVQLKRFQQEATLASRLDHPNLVRAIEHGEDNGIHFFAMEFIDGESVGGRLKRERLKRLPEDEAVRIVAGVAAALHEAHRKGMVHRDVKPDNIMLTSAGEVKLADMGLAKEMDNDLGLTKTGRGLGTPHFMAPEQFRDAKHADARCDVYSLGATLYMMVTGVVPFKAPNPLDAFTMKSRNEYQPPEEIVPTLSAKLVKAIKRAMDADPDKRPQDAAMFAAMLPGSPVPQGEMWYVVYHDQDGSKKKIKGTKEMVLGMARGGKLGPDAVGSQDRAGPFLPLAEIPLFAGKVRAAAGAANASLANESQYSVAAIPAGTSRKTTWREIPPPPPFPWWMVGVAIAVAVVGIAFVALRR